MFRQKPDDCAFYAHLCYELYCFSVPKQVVLIPNAKNANEHRQIHNVGPLLIFYLLGELQRNEFLSPIVSFSNQSLIDAAPTAWIHL